jgi:hypothetical protein
VKHLKNPVAFMTHERHLRLIIHRRALPKASGLHPSDALAAHVTAGA